MAAANLTLGSTYGRIPDVGPEIVADFAGQTDEPAAAAQQNKTGKRAEATTP